MSKPKKRTMNISLTPELADFIERKVASGLYTSNSEVVREALRHYGTAESDHMPGELERIKVKVQEALDDVKAGRLADWTASDVMKEARARLEAKALKIKE
ncbi:MAG: type II toxin-antitoxin system ParD family antitoxin [Fimbriimonadaceae bacterium]